MAGRKPRVRRKRKNTYAYIQPKLIFVLVVVISMMIGLVGRIVFIQKNDGERYEKKVLAQKGYTNSIIPYRRGEILDAKGTILATSVDVYNIILDCNMIHQHENYAEPTIKAILQFVPDATEEEVRDILQNESESRYYIYRRQVPYDEIKDFMDFKDAVHTEGEKKGKKVNPHLEGVWFEKEYIRKYPYDTLACKVLGFTTTGNVGIGGLEDFYNSTLNGKNGRRYGYLNEENHVENNLKNPVNGNSLITTIDLNIQSIVEEKITEFDEKYRDEVREGPGSVSTAVLLMDPNTGGILAMADSTSYNLNDPWGQEGYIQFCTEHDEFIQECLKTYKEYAGYTQEMMIDLFQVNEEDSEEEKKRKEKGRLDILNVMWQNMAISYTYEPGSTVKPFTVATGFETGSILPEDTYYCDGVEQIGTHKIHCVNRSGHGPQTTEQSLMFSCNDALMQMSYKIGIENFVKYQNIFNIGLRTNIDLPGEARTDALIYTEENMGETSLATNSFGQNFNTTMIQVASGFSSIINGGYYYQPYLVQKIVDEDGNIVEQKEPIVLKHTVSPKTSDLIRKYLVTTVDEGTASGAKVPGYSMGGKTGTAEKQPRDDKKYLVSYIGFAPAENPQILIYVIINEPNLENQAQSGLATALAKDIMTEVFPYLNLFPDEPVEESQLLQEETLQGDGTEAEPGQEGDLEDEIEEQSGQGETAEEEIREAGQGETAEEEIRETGQGETAEEEIQEEEPGENTEEGNQQAVQQGETLEETVSQQETSQEEDSLPADQEE